MTDPAAIDLLIHVPDRESAQTLVAQVSGLTGTEAASTQTPNLDGGVVDVLVFVSSSVAALKAVLEFVVHMAELRRERIDVTWGDFEAKGITRASADQLLAAAIAERKGDDGRSGDATGRSRG